MNVKHDDLHAAMLFVPDANRHELIIAKHLHVLQSAVRKLNDVIAGYDADSDSDDADSDSDNDDNAKSLHIDRDDLPSLEAVSSSTSSSSSSSPAISNKSHHLFWFLGGAVTAGSIAMILSHRSSRA